MALTREQEKKLLVVLLVALAGLAGYRTFTGEEQKIAPLTYTRGMVASSPVRKGLATPSGTDTLTAFLERRTERYPGVSRDIFRMENPAPKPKPVPKPPETPPVVTLPTPTVPVKSPEEIAREEARADLGKFRFLGYVAERRDSSLFLSKDGELFIVKSGDALIKSYRVKEAGRDFVVLQDTATKVEVRVDLSGSEQTPQKMR
jgi:hypothetical protein